MEETIKDIQLTIFGGHGFVGSRYLDRHSDRVVNNNIRDDYNAHSKDVLYFISTVHNYNIFDDPHLDINTNLTVLMKVLSNWKTYLESNNIDKSTATFNFISSWFVYGEGNVSDVKEDAYCNPKGFYSITKRAAEQLLISYCQTFGLNYRILRLGNVIGPGDQKVSAKKNALQYLVNKLKINEDLDIYNDGRFYRDYIHVDDCADAIDIILANGNQNEIYNIGNGKSWYFIDILWYIRRILNSNSMIRYIQSKPFHDLVQVKSFYMNTEKLQNLGYSPRYKNEELFDTLIL